MAIVNNFAFGTLESRIEDAIETISEFIEQTAVDEEVGSMTDRLVHFSDTITWNTNYEELSSNDFDDQNNVTSIESHGIMLRPNIDEMVLTVCIIIID